jgi:nitroreductase
MRKGTDMDTQNRRKVLRMLATGGIAASAAPLVAQSGLNAATAINTDIFDVISRRRSYRNFTGEGISQEDLDKILAAGMQAPSANDCRPWDFVVVRNIKIIRKIVTQIPAIVYVEKAAALIVTCMDKRIKADEYEMKLLSMACCSMNMILAVEALNYAGVWLSMAHHDGNRQGICKKVLALPDYTEAFNIVAVGVPVAVVPKENRFDPKRIHLEQW